MNSGSGFSHWCLSGSCFPKDKDSDPEPPNCVYLEASIKLFFYKEVQRKFCLLIVDHLQRTHYLLIIICWKTLCLLITVYWDLLVVTNPTVYNRSIYKYNLIDVYKYNLIDACINVFLESLERIFMLAIFKHGNLVWPYYFCSWAVSLLL